MCVHVHTQCLTRYFFSLTTLCTKSKILWVFVIAYVLRSCSKPIKRRSSNSRSTSKQLYTKTNYSNNNNNFSRSHLQCECVQRQNVRRERTTNNIYAQANLCYFVHTNVHTKISCDFLFVYQCNNHMLVVLIHRHIHTLVHITNTKRRIFTYLTIHEHFTQPQRRLLNLFEGFC